MSTVVEEFSNYMQQFFLRYQFHNPIKTYSAARSLFRSRLLSKATTIILYKTLIRPVVLYGAETWMLTKKEEQALLIIER